ncbi:MAG: hypothetical protein AAFO03_17000, partial [Bacteroidota bacterium]
MKASTGKENATHSHTKPFFTQKREGSFFSQTKEAEQPFFTPEISKRTGGDYHTSHKSFFQAKPQATLQNKLTINKPEDQYKPEADVMANKVMRRQHAPEVQTGSAESEPVEQEAKREVQQKVEKPVQHTPPEQKEHHTQNETTNHSEHGSSGKGDTLRTQARNTIEGEIAAVTSEPNVEAEVKEGQPTILVPKEYPRQNTPHVSLPNQDITEPPSLEPELLSISPEPTKKINQNYLEQAVHKDKLEPKNDSLLGKSKEPSAKGQPIAYRKSQDEVETDTNVSDQLTSVIVPATPSDINKEIPDRELTEEEFIEELSTGQTLAQKSAQVQQLLNDLKTNTEQEKQSIFIVAENKKMEILSAAEDKIASIQNQIDSRINHIIVGFDNAHSTLQAYAIQQKALVEAQYNQDIIQLTTNTDTSIAELENSLEQRKNQITTFSQTESQQPFNIAESEGQRVNSELQSAANQAEVQGESVANRYPGREEPNPEKRAAAREVGTESAQDIRSKIPGIQSELRNKAEEYAGRYSPYAQNVHSKIDEAKTPLVDSLKNIAESTRANLNASKSSAMKSIETRLQIDFQALKTNKDRAVSDLQTSGKETISSLRQTSNQYATAIDGTMEAILLDIDFRLEEAEQIINNEQDPYVAGMRDVIDAIYEAIRLSSSQGQEQVGNIALFSSEALQEQATVFDDTSSKLLQHSDKQINQIISGSQLAMTQSVQQHSTTAQKALSDQLIQQRQVIAEGLNQIDQGIEQAKEEMRSVSEQFRTELTTVTDDSIEEAKKPLTDDTRSRAQAAANDVEGGWLSGILSAVGELVLGFLVLVAIALVVAALTGLTLGGALLIVGAVFLVVATVVAYNRRSAQLAEMGIEASGWDVFRLAVSDASGITGIMEAWTGEEFLTNRQLGDAERGRRGTIGIVSLVGIILGARAAVKGPPGGWTRPTSIFRGFRAFNFWANVRGAWSDIVAIGAFVRSFGRRTYKAFKEAEGIGDFFRRIFARRQSIPDDNVPDDNVPDDNVPDDNVPDDNVPDDNVPNDKVPDDNVPDDNVPDDNVPDDNVSDDNVP